jgi:carbonic anhydrase
VVLVWFILSLTRFCLACVYPLFQDMEKNARPVQDVNDRDISIFRPKPHKHY